MSAVQQRNDEISFDEELGFRLKMLRQMKQLSQEELGSILGTSYQQVQKYETGKRKVPPYRLKQCADALGVSVSYLVNGSDYEERYTQFDKRVITIASAIASLPNPDIAQQIYRLAMTIGTDEK